MLSRTTRVAGTVLVAAALTCASACESATTAPTLSFALDAGNYTLTLSGGGTSGGAVPNACMTNGSGVMAGTVSVVVARSGSTWSARPTTSPDANWAMTFTTDGAAVGTVTGSMAGPTVDSTTAVAITVTKSAIDGRNSNSTNTAGGAIQGAVSFTATSGGATCTFGNWTLTPR